MEISNKIETTVNVDEFLPLLQKKWANLIFCPVTKVLHGKVLRITRHVLFKDGEIAEFNNDANEFDEFQTTERYRDVVKVWDEKSYHSYYGFVNTSPIKSDTVSFQKILNIRPKTAHSTLNFNGRTFSESIRFDHSSHCDFDPRTFWFSTMIKNYSPPIKDDIVCGIALRGPKGLYFDRWFTCTWQFYTLWKIVMFGRSIFQNYSGEKLIEYMDRSWNHDLKYSNDRREGILDGRVYSIQEQLLLFDPFESRLWREGYGELHHLLRFILTAKNHVPFDRKSIQFDEKDFDRIEDLYDEGNAHSYHIELAEKYVKDSVKPSPQRSLEIRYDFYATIMRGLKCSEYFNFMDFITDEEFGKIEDRAHGQNSTIVKWFRDY